MPTFGWYSGQNEAEACLTGKGILAPDLPEAASPAQLHTTVAAEAGSACDPADMHAFACGTRTDIVMRRRAGV